MMPYMIMDERDRTALFDLMRPFQARAVPHLEGAKLADLAVCIDMEMSVDECVAKAAAHKAHIDAIIAIKRESQAVREKFRPQYPLVDILDREGGE